MKNYILYITMLLLLGLVSINFSCKKLVEVGPPYTSVTGDNIFKDDFKANAAVTGIYTQLSSYNLDQPNVTGSTLLTGLASDELILFPGNGNVALNQYFKNSYTAASGYGFWEIYDLLYRINTCIYGVQKSTTLTPSIQKELLAESKFLRAFCYFYLVNYFGDVPLATGTDYKVNSTLPRASKEVVYDQMISDLKDAEINLSDQFIDGTLKVQSEERTRPNKWAAKSLLSRIYLYQKRFVEAEEKATEVISNTSMFELVSIDNAFLKNNKEAIWQIQPINSGQNTWEGKMFILGPAGPNNVSNPVYLSQALLHQFKKGDQRKLHWIDSVTVNGITYAYPYKYKLSDYGAPVNEYQNVLRLAEQYLIRAEARIENNDIINGVKDINTIRQRASDITAAPAEQLVMVSSSITKDEALNAVLSERQLELFTEWGHRWLDIKRSSKINDIMSKAAIIKGSVWNDFRQLFPIPSNERLLNPKLTQNLGY